MRLFVLGVGFLTACASATPEGAGMAADAQQVDGFVRRDAAIDAAVSVCPSTETCTGAMMMGAVSGDTGNGKLMATGYRSAWLRVRVTENNSDILGLTLRVAAKLTPPPGVDFDAFVYVNSGSDAVECASTMGTAMMNGGVEETRAEWGEGALPNGVDDSRNVSIEIRPVSGTCAPTAMWKLEVEGNWI